MIDGYSKTIRKSPALTALEEYELFKRYHAGETKLEERLVTSHIRVVLTFVNRYEGYGIPKSELIQEGMIGLLRAVRNFKSGHNARLMTYALECIKTQVHEYIIKNYRTVRIATNDAQRKLFFSIRKYRENSGKLTIEEAKRIAIEKNVTLEDVLDMDARFRSKEVELVTDSSSDESEVLQIPDDSSLEPENLLDEKQTNLLIKRVVNAILDTLTPNEQYTIKSRFFSEEKKTMQEIANEFGVTLGRVNQIEKSAIKKMKERLKEKM